MATYIIEMTTDFRALDIRTFPISRSRMTTTDVRAFGMTFDTGKVNVHA